MDDDRTQHLGAAAHRRTIGLIGKIARSERVIDGPAGADEQSAVLTGIMQAVAEIMWLGRNDGMSVPELLETWNDMGKLLLGQAALHHMPGNAPAQH